MNPQKMLEIAPLFVGAPGEEKLVQSLIERGLTVEEAERCVVFMPLAFGRVLLEHLGVTKMSPFFWYRKQEGKVG